MLPCGNTFGGICTFLWMLKTEKKLREINGTKLNPQWTRVGLEWDLIVTRLELKWDSNGTRMGLKWDSNGTRMGLEWTRIGLEWAQMGL